MAEEKIHTGEEQEQPRDLTAKKLSGPNHVSVTIRMADEHYLASFHHAPNRVFHTIDQLLKAIEEEVNKISSRS